MVKRFLIAVVLSSSCLAGYHGTTGTVGIYTLEQWGVTWTFDKILVTTAPNYTINYLVGQYANGDFWVYDNDGTVTITAIDPAKTTVVQDAPHAGTFTVDGSMINPTPVLTAGETDQWGNTKQGLDSRLNGFDDSVSLATPITLTGLNSLLTAKSWRFGETGCPASNGSTNVNGPRPPMKYGAVLTTVASVPSAGSFRPAYCGTTTKITTHNTSQMDLSILPSLTNIGAGPTKLSTFNSVGFISLYGWSEMLQRPWWDFMPRATAEYGCPSENGNCYGVDYAKNVSTAALTLCLTPDTGIITTAERQTLAIQMIQLGIDTYGIVANTGGWGHNGAGEGQGRKFPVLFAGVALDYATYKAIGTVPSDPTHILFQEDAQPFYIQSADVTRFSSTSLIVTRNNCSVSISDPYLIVDDDGGDWQLADVGGGAKIPQRSGVANKNFDFWLIWNYGTAGQEFVRIYSAEHGTDPAHTMRLRDPVTPGTGRTARVQLYPADRLGLIDWAGGSSSDHWTHPTLDWKDRNYRYCCNANSWIGIELAAYAITTKDGKGTIKTLWSNQAFFDYTDSYEMDMLSSYQLDTSQRYVSLWHANMWDTYRPGYDDLYIEPTIYPIGDKSCSGGETVSFTVHDNDGTGNVQTDINGDGYTYAIDAASIAKGMSINASTGAFSWVTTSKNAGTHNVYFTMTNAASRSVYQGITITVSGDAPPSNPTAPTLTAIPDQEMILNVAGMTVAPFATDPDPGEVLTFTSTTLPPGLTINATTGRISGTPTSPGRFSITVTVTDATARTASRTFVLDINNGTHPTPFFK
jgi:hypothetical protein